MFSALASPAIFEVLIRAIKICQALTFEGKFWNYVANWCIQWRGGADCSFPSLQCDVFLKAFWLPHPGL